MHSDTRTEEAFTIFGSQHYEISLGNWESILVGLCEIISAPYRVGDFERAEANHQESRESSSDWTIQGNSACKLTISIESCDSYYFGVLSGRGAVFSEAKRYLWWAYLDQGGNLDAQQEL